MGRVIVQPKPAPPPVVEEPNEEEALRDKIRAAMPPSPFTEAWIKGVVESYGCRLLGTDVPVSGQICVHVAACDYSYIPPLHNYLQENAPAGIHVVVDYTL